MFMHLFVFGFNPQSVNEFLLALPVHSVFQIGHVPYILLQGIKGCINGGLQVLQWLSLLSILTAAGWDLQLHPWASVGGLFLFGFLGILP